MRYKMFSIHYDRTFKKQINCVQVAVQLLSRVQLFVTPCIAACQAPLSSNISQSLLKLMSIESVILCNHFILCRSLFFLLSIFSSISVFSNNLALHIRWPKYWSFNFGFNMTSSNEYLRLISSRIDWFDLLAVQGTLKNLLQQHSSKASILWHSAFFMAQASPYMTAGKTIALTMHTDLCQQSDVL